MGYTDQHTVPQEFLERKRIKNTDPHFMWIVGVVDKLASVAVSQNQGVVEQLQYTHSELLSHYTNNERWTDRWTEGGREKQTDRQTQRQRVVGVRRQAN